jgi:hypothetical protein
VKKNRKKVITVQPFEKNKSSLKSPNFVVGKTKEGKELL